MFLAQTDNWSCNLTQFFSKQENGIWFFPLHRERQANVWQASCSRPDEALYWDVEEGPRRHSHQLETPGKSPWEEGEEPAVPFWTTSRSGSPQRDWDHQAWTQDGAVSVQDTQTSQKPGRVQAWFFSSHLCSCGSRCDVNIEWMNAKET